MLSKQSQKQSEKARAAAKNADQLYLESVKNLEESRALWDREMELLCRVCVSMTTVAMVLPW